MQQPVHNFLFIAEQEFIDQRVNLLNIFAMVAASGLLNRFRKYIAVGFKFDMRLADALRNDGKQIEIDAVQEIARDRIVCLGKFKIVINRLNQISCRRELIVFQQNG